MLLESVDKFIAILEDDKTKEALGVSEVELGDSGKDSAESAPANDNAEFEKSKGREIEKEHKNVYDLFKKFADENNLEMPITEEELYDMIAGVHIDESGGADKSHYYKYLVEMEDRIKKELSNSSKE